MEKAAYELGFELANRPDYVEIPLQGLLQIADIYREEDQA